MQEWYLGLGKGVLFREVSSVQECPHRERERERERGSTPCNLSLAGDFLASREAGLDSL